MLGMLKFPDDFSKSQGLNQCWIKDTGAGDGNPGNNENEGFKLRRNYIINMPADTNGNSNKGTFSFKIPLKYFFGFCEDYRKILYGMQQKLTLTRTGDNNAILKRNAAVGGGVAAEGKVNLKKNKLVYASCYPL